MQQYGCPECRRHFELMDSVLHTDNAFVCDYHTDFTGRQADKDRLNAEWEREGDAITQAMERG